MTIKEMLERRFEEYKNMGNKRKTIDPVTTHHAESQLARIRLIYAKRYGGVLR